ncbi:Galactose mutarotase [Microbacterium sp. ru370.1]|uniref:hypothetical protein n=1 Tax=unclassified Microbacterium TaxID=2609290 RepID=UPI000881B811|nr:MULTISPECIES: hypothetical protein [unclassified Microbacterium]SDO42442.1 Galactose mutarotase [Microbacterium sp. ru370.1]SIT80263.1 Galactose mutarotase [Microbacterium sp. RU1D]
MSAPRQRVSLQAGDLRAEVDAEGARIARLTHVPTGREILATTPWADEGRDAFSIADSSGEWHRRYPGGWHVLLPRAGDAPAGVSPPQPFHGEAAWRTWTLSSEGSSCRARVRLRTVPLDLDRVVTLDESGLRVATAVHNHSTETVRIGWAEHPAFAGDLFDDATTSTGGGVLSVAPAPSAGFDDVSAAAGSLTVAGPDLALELAWDARLFPRLFVWRERRGSSGFPWWRQVDAVGLEPSSDPYAQPGDALGSVVVAPGATVRSAVTLRVRGVDASTA